jgi:hypothetical protein
MFLRGFLLWVLKMPSLKEQLDQLKSRRERRAQLEAELASLPKPFLSLETEDNILVEIKDEILELKESVNSILEKLSGR